MCHTLVFRDFLANPSQALDPKDLRMDEETEWKEWSRAPKKIMTCLVGTLEGASIYWTLNPCFSTSGCVGGCRHLEYLFRKKKRRAGGPCESSWKGTYQCRSRHVWDPESEATCKHDVMMLSFSRWISFRTTVFQDLTARPVSDSGDHLWSTEMRYSCRWYVVVFRNRWMWWVNGEWVPPINEET